MWGKIVSFFQALFGSDVSVNTTINKHDKKAISKKKLKHSVDNSSINNIDQQLLYTNNGTFIGTQNISKLATEEKIILTARWYYLVPHKIVKMNDGFDELNILKPVDESFVKPSINIYYDGNHDKHHGIYFLAKCNNAITNFKITNVELILDTCVCTLNISKDVFGTIETDKGFVLFESSMKEGEGTLQIEVSYEKNDVRYKQVFDYSVPNDNREFVMNKYNQPIPFLKKQAGETI